MSTSAPALATPFDTTSHGTTLGDTRTEVKASVGPRVAAHLPFAKSGSTDHTAAVEETRKAYIQASSSRNARYALARILH